MINYCPEEYVRPETKQRQQRARAAAVKVFNMMFAEVQEYHDFDTFKELIRRPSYYEQWQSKAARRVK